MARFKQWIPVVLLLAALFPLAAQAQFDDNPDEKEHKKVSGGWGFFTPGYQMTSMAPLNASLASAGLGTYQDNAITTGGGGYLVISNFLIGGEGGSLLRQEVSSATGQSRLEGGWGTFNIGYTPWATDKGLVLVPRVGIGGYNYRLFLQDGAGPSTFPGIVASPGTASWLEKKGLLLTADLGLNYSISYKQGRGGGFFVGLDVGYNYCPKLDEWTLWGEPVQGGPGIDLSGAFVRLRVGGAGWHRQ